MVDIRSRTLGAGHKYQGVVLVVDIRSRTLGAGHN